MREPIIPRRYQIAGSNDAAYSDIRDPAELIRTPEPAVRRLMRLRPMEHEGSALDGVSPALRAGASDFGKTQSHQRSSPPLIRPTDVGYLRLTLLSNGTRRWAVHGPAPLARHPASRPGQEASPQRIRGGSKQNSTSPRLKRPHPSPLPLGEGWGEASFARLCQPLRS